MAALPSINAADPVPEPLTTLPTVTVSADRDTHEDSVGNRQYTRSTAATATKTDTPILALPLSIQVVPRQVLRDQQVFRLDHALRNVSGVVASPGIEGDEVTIRGFASTAIFRDGARLPSADLNSVEETVHLERIEILKGPGAILYGQMEPGGMVNQITKQPLTEPYHEFTQQVGTYDFFRTTLDAGGPVSVSAPLAYRFNLAYQSNDEITEDIHTRRIFLAPVLRWEISPTTRVTLQLQYKDSLDPLKVAIPFMGGRPLAVPREVNLGHPDLGNREDQIYGGLHWSHQFNNGWALNHRLFLSDLDQTSRSLVAEAVASGDETLLQRIGSDVNSRQHYYYTALNLTGIVDTGGVDHELLVGGDFTGQAGELNATQFEYRPLDPMRPLHDNRRKRTGVLAERSGFGAYGFYVQDQVRLPMDLRLLAGFRYDHVWDRTEAIVDPNDPARRTVTDETVEDEAVTPRLGLLWQPRRDLSVYASYTENFGASSDFNALGRPLPPETAQQWEVGVKTSLADGRLTGTLALFDLTKQNVARVDPGDPRFRIATGEVRHRGVELDLAGDITPSCQLIASYALLGSAITRDSAEVLDAMGNVVVSDGSRGNRLAGTPQQSGSLWSACEISIGGLKGFRFGAGLYARSENYADSADNDLRLPAYATVNVMLGYERRLGASQLSLQLNVDNLLDETYFEAASTAGAHYGPPRTLIGVLRFEF